MKRVNRWIRPVGGAAVLALALSGTVGCGPTTTIADPATAPAATGTAGSAGAGASAPAASAAATGAPSTAASPALPDGRSPAYLTGLDTTRKTVTFDLIEFLTGDEAKVEWKKEHPDNPDGPDDDYLIVNNNPMLRTLPVAADAQCVVLSTLGGTDTKTISFAALPAFLKQENDEATPTAPDIAVLPFWLTVQHGTVVKFEEQFLP
jgi:hypothetical protein